MIPAILTNVVLLRKVNRNLTPNATAGSYHDGNLLCGHDERTPLATAWLLQISGGRSNHVFRFFLDTRSKVGIEIGPTFDEKAQVRG